MYINPILPGAIAACHLPGRKNGLPGGEKSEIFPFLVLATRQGSTFWQNDEKILLMYINTGKPKGGKTPRYCVQKVELPQMIPEKSEDRGRKIF